METINDSHLYLGNNFDILNQLSSRSVNLIIADPPYEIDNDSKIKYMAEFERICKGAIIIFCSPENPWYSNYYRHPDQFLFWIKPISTKNTSKSYSRFVEEILVWNDRSKNPIWNINRHWSQYTNVFTDIVDGKLHPFQKPYSLIERLVLNHSNPNDIVLDPFAGSGTVSAVCNNTLRSSISIEINKYTYDVMLSRLKGEKC